MVVLRATLQVFSVIRMDFRLIQGSSAYSAGTNYCTEPDLASDVDPKALDLDEIILVRDGKEIKIGGRANVAAMGKAFGTAGIAFAVYAVQLLVSIEFFLREVCPVSSPPPRKGVEGYSAHFLTLQRGGVVAPLTRETQRKARSYSGYFAVVKSGDPPTARSIFNGKKFSQRCRAPPPTNLPDFLRILEALDFIIRTCGRALYIHVADIRHAFHQLPLCYASTFFFCIRLAPNSDNVDARWRWLTLPMGWAWSPFICQSVGFGILLLVLAEVFPGDPQLNAYKKMPAPPPFILFFDKDQKPFLLIALWYDNIGVFSSIPETFDKITSRLQKKFESLHYFWKEWKSHPPRDMNVGVPGEPGRNPEYLGVSLRFVRTRAHDESFMPRLQWQVTKKKRDKWQQLSIMCESSCRKIAGVLGVIFWITRLQFMPLCRREQELELLRRVSERSSSGGGWDCSFTMSLAETLLLKDGLVSACADTWFQKPIDTTDEKIYVATDSSKPKWAYVIWRNYRGSHEKPHAGSWSTFGKHNDDAEAGIVAATIFVKELLTAVLAIEFICRTNRRKKIVLFIDNTAAAGVCRRLASSTVYGNELARRIDVALSRSECVLEVVTLLSEQNPADSPTRNRGMCQNRIEAMWTVWDEYQKGIISSLPRRRAPMQNGVRHSEKTDPDSDFDSDDDENPDDDAWPDLSVDQDDEEEGVTSS